MHGAISGLFKMIKTISSEYHLQTCIFYFKLGNFYLSSPIVYNFDHSIKHCSCEEIHKGAWFCPCYEVFSTLSKGRFSPVLSSLQDYSCRYCIKKTPGKYENKSLMIPMRKLYFVTF